MSENRRAGPLPTLSPLSRPEARVIAGQRRLPSKGFGALPSCWNLYRRAHRKQELSQLASGCETGALTQLPLGVIILVHRYISFPGAHLHWSARSGRTPKWGFGVAMLPVGALCFYQAHFGRTVLPKWPFWAHLFYSVFYSVSEFGRACFRQARVA